MRDSRYDVQDRAMAGATPLLLLVLMAAAGCGIGVCYSAGDNLAVCSFLAVGVGALLGYSTGVWKMFSMLVGSAAGYHLAGPTAKYLVPWIESTLDERLSSPILGLILAGIVAGCAVTVVVMGCGLLLINRIDLLKWLDQRLGMLVGCVQSAGLVAVIIWGILAIEPKLQALRETRTEGLDQVSRVHERLLGVAAAVKKSRLLSHLVSWNPFLDVPQLRNILDRTEEFAQALRAPQGQPGSVIEALGSDAPVRRVVNKLESAEDVETVVETLHSNDIGQVIQKLVDGQYKSAK